MNRSISIFKRGAYTSRNQFTGLSFHFVLKRRKTLISPAMECSRLFGRRALCNCRLIVSRFNWLTESFFHGGNSKEGNSCRTSRANTSVAHRVGYLRNSHTKVFMEEQSIASPQISTDLMTVSGVQDSYSRLFASVAQLF